MVEKSKDYTKLREFLDGGLVVTLTFRRLLSGRQIHCQAYSDGAHYYFDEDTACPVLLDDNKFKAFCVLYDVEYEKPKKDLNYVYKYCNLQYSKIIG